MNARNSLKVVISQPVFDILIDTYNFHFVPCEDMPDCGEGREFHLVPPLGDLVNKLDDVEAAKFRIEDLTEEGGKRRP
jgi:hypothetical protein